MTSWLDPETKALLQKLPPDKLAPPDIDGFTLVLLSVHRADLTRLPRAVQRILGGSFKDAAASLHADLPIPVKRGLTLADAMLGQFELICCDAISVFIADGVVSGARPGYLDDLYGSLLRSHEFAETTLRIERLPVDVRGEAFIDQFLGHSPDLPAVLTLSRKKARIIYQWANRIGAQVSLSGD